MLNLTTVETTDTKVSNDTKVAYIVSSLTDNVVPAKDTDFVNFGNYSDIKNIVKSKKFYPVRSLQDYLVMVRHLLLHRHVLNQNVR